MLSCFSSLELLIVRIWVFFLGIELVLGTRVKCADVRRKTLLTATGETISYNILIIATGARVFHLTFILIQFEQLRLTFWWRWCYYSEKWLFWKCCYIGMVTLTNQCGSKIWKQNNTAKYFFIFFKVVVVVLIITIIIICELIEMCSYVCWWKCAFRLRWTYIHVLGAVALLDLGSLPKLIWKFWVCFQNPHEKSWVLPQNPHENCGLSPKPNYLFGSTSLKRKSWVYQCFQRSTEMERSS